MPVTLTDRAAQHVQRYIEKRGKGVGLRLGVRTTGCSGLAYKLEFADEIQPEDQTFESNGVQVLASSTGTPSDDDDDKGLPCNSSASATPGSGRALLGGLALPGAGFQRMSRPLS